MTYFNLTINQIKYGKSITHIPYKSMILVDKILAL